MVVAVGSAELRSVAQEVAGDAVPPSIALEAVVYVELRSVVQEVAGDAAPPSIALGAE